jgi:competence protein ComEA
MHSPTTRQARGRALPDGLPTRLMTRLLAGLLMVLAVAFAPAAHAFDLELNEASQAELESLPGVGPALSARFIAARREGLFEGWTDAMRRVRGLGPAAAQRLSAAGLTVGGASYEPAAAVPPRSGRAPRPSASAGASPASAR